jgi:DNA-binding XRE family transcriptional regulator
MKKTCVECRGTMTERETRFDVSVRLEHSSAAVRVPVPGWVCEVCESARYDAESLQRAELAAAVSLIDRGVRSGMSFRFVRKALGYKAADLARLLAVTPETVSRWENGRTIDRTVWAVLASLALDRLAGGTHTIERLQAVPCQAETDDVVIEASAAVCLVAAVRSKKIRATLIVTDTAAEADSTLPRLLATVPAGEGSF